MISDAWIDYPALLPTHRCTRPLDDGWCGGTHQLRTYPVDDGFIVAVCCDSCRDRNGLPTKYSVETPSFPTFETAETSRKALLRVKDPDPIVPTQNVLWHKRSGKWRVQLRRDGRAIYLGSFSEHHDAVAARDRFLEAA